ncbi:MAG: NPXTG-anchored protein [Ruminococcus sp.]|nr:NPXTG-anchored protein [Ruminococcus sp.]
MKLKKIFAVLSATALAASCMAISASAATRLPDVCHPDENDAEMNDLYYGQGGMGFFMNNTWDAWNQGEWSGIDDDGIIDVSYHINAVLADKSMSGKGSLGMMGVMFPNLDKIGEEYYPFEVTVLEAEFTDEDGNVTQLDTVKEITEGNRHPEGGFRIIIRPTDDPDNPDVKATPEVAGWDEEGAFNGGTLHIKVDFGKYEPESEDSSEAANDSTTDESKSDESKTDKDSKTDDSNASGTDSNASSKSDSSSSKGGNGNGGGNGGNGGSKGGATAAATSAEDGEAKSDATESSDTGAAQGVALAVIALAGAGIVVAKKKH